MGEDTYSTVGFDEIEIRLYTESRIYYSAELLLPDGQRFSSRLPAADLKKLRELNNPISYGEGLFKWLFQGELGEVYKKTSYLARIPTRVVTPDFGLRLRLWLDPESAELQCLNWEALWDPEFGPISTQTAFSRFIRVPATLSRLSQGQALKMVFIGASPEEGSILEIKDELTSTTAITSADSSQYKQNFALDAFIEPLTPSLLQTIANNNYRIIHFQTRSFIRAGQRYMVLAGKDGKPQETPIEEVVDLMGVLAKQQPALVFISAPTPPDLPKIETEDYLGPALINMGARAVITMETVMGAKDLAEFTREFYYALSRTGVVDEATARARRSIFDPKLWDWTAPTLYTRSQENIQVFQQIADSKIMSSVIGVTIDKIGG